MASKSFGQYLVDEGLITAREHDEALLIQNKNRLLGEIAIEMNYLTREQAHQVKEKVDQSDNLKFGEAAVTLGFINTNQLRYLLDIRTRRKVRLGEVLVENGFFDNETMLKAVMAFNQSAHGLEKVLIVGQSLAISRVLQKIVTKYGYNTFVARTGKEAGVIAQREKPDILITGFTLSDMDGIDLCRSVLSSVETSRTNIILLSSEDTEGRIDEAFMNGVNHFIKYPVLEEELINVIYLIEKEASEKRPERILVVDDNHGTRTIISRELAKAGYHVFQAPNGKVALERAAEIKPDIITMDIEMPVMNGFDACRALKNDADTCDIPVIIISSLSGVKIRERGFNVGAVEFFTKPFKSGHLANYVDMLLESKKIKKNERVLVADDNGAMRHIIKYLFTKNGFKVFSTKNGKEALEILPKCKPDLIVTDCYMPGMDGFELTKKIKSMEQYHHVPIIMVTGAGSRKDTLKGLAAGASDYMVKPFDESELIARAGTHLLNKKLFDEITKERNELKEAKKQLTEFAEKMEALAITDFLTGAFNRRHFIELTEIEIAKANRHKTPLSIILMDIDHFKKINDVFGHATGDKALVEVVRVSKDILRASDIFCRFGGEEFIIALPQTEIEQAKYMAERLRTKIEEIVIDSSIQQIQFTASCGISALSPEDKNIDEVIKRADEALYTAKNNGRNRTEIA